MRKTKKRNILSRLIILLLILIIIVVGLIIFLNNNTKQNIINKTDPNGDSITIIDENDNESQQFIDSDDKEGENKEKEYQELNAMTYYTNNKDNKTFRIQDVIHNQDGTITIRGRVYKYVDLPTTLSAKEYQALIDGKSLNILGEKVTKIENDEKAQEAKYEMALKIETKEYDYDIVYYVNKNDDGTANLYNGSDSSIAEGTNVYLEKKLNGDFECYLFDEKVALKDYFKKDVHIADKNKTRLFYQNDEFIIEKEDNYFVRLVLSGF